MFQAQEPVEITLPSEEIRFLGTIRYADGQQVLVTCSPADAIHLQVGSRLQLVQVVNGSFYQIESSIVRCEKNGFLAPVTPPQLVQRRRTPRIECYLKARYLSLAKADTAQLETDGEEAEILDISLGGAKALVNRMLIAGSQYIVEIDLPTGEKVCAQVQALRCTLRQNDAQSGARFQVALHFTQLSRNYFVQLQRFVLHYLPPT